MGVDLYHATLTRASLRGAKLANANLIGAILTKVDLGAAILTEASLVGATLIGADLGLAILTETKLAAATLTEVKELRAWQLAEAEVTLDTVLDKALAQNAWVQARIEACKGREFGAPVPAPTPDPSQLQGPPE